MTVNYHVLNRQQKKDVYPLPRIDDMLDKLAHARFLSAIDLASGYHQVGLAKDTQGKTAFVTRYGILKGATACCSWPTVCYLLGEAPPGIWACPSVSRVGLCRDCSGRLVHSGLFRPFETLSLDLLGLLRPIGRTLGLKQGYCALGSVFHLCGWVLQVYPLHFIRNSTSGHCCP